MAGILHRQELQSVIELALANNRDLRMATLNVEKVQAQYRIQRAQQFPTVSASVTRRSLPASEHECRPGLPSLRR